MKLWILLLIMLMPMTSAQLQLGGEGNDSVRGIYIQTPTASAGQLFDGNASSICSGNTVLLGNGTCANADGISAAPTEDIWVNETGDTMTGNLYFSDVLEGVIFSSTTDNAELRSYSATNIRGGFPSDRGGQMEYYHRDDANWPGDLVFVYGGYPNTGNVRFSYYDGTTWSSVMNYDSAGNMNISGYLYSSSPVKFLEGIKIVDRFGFNTSIIDGFFEIYSAFNDKISFDGNQTDPHTLLFKGDQGMRFWSDSAGAEMCGLTIDGNLSCSGTISSDVMSLSYNETYHNLIPLINITYNATYDAGIPFWYNNTLSVATDSRTYLNISDLIISFNETKLNVTIQNIADQSIYHYNMTTPAFITPGGFNWNMTDDGSNVILDMSAVAGNNYWGVQTDGAFIQLYSNPNPAIDYLLFTITETQGADTFLNFYEGGTGHNRFWDSGSARFGGSAGSLCSQLTTDVDCDTPLTGADVVIEDDLWSGGKGIFRDLVNSSTEVYVNNATAVSPWLYNSTDTGMVQSVINATSLDLANTTIRNKLCFDTAQTHCLYYNGSATIWT